MIDEFANCLAAMGCGHPRSHAVLCLEVLPDLIGGLVISCPLCRATQLNLRTILDSGMCPACGQRITSLRVQPNSSTATGPKPTETTVSNGGPAHSEPCSGGTPTDTKQPSQWRSSRSSENPTGQERTTSPTSSGTHSSPTASFTVNVATDSRERTAAEIERHLSVVLHKPVTVD